MHDLIPETSHTTKVHDRAGYRSNRIEHVLTCGPLTCALKLVHVPKTKKPSTGVPTYMHILEAS